MTDRYLPKPQIWPLEPEWTEKPHWWQNATVLPMWEQKGLPWRYGKAGNGPTTVGALSGSVEDTDWTWAKTAEGWAIKTISTTAGFYLGKDSVINPKLDRGTVLVVMSPQNTNTLNGEVFSNGATSTPGEYYQILIPLASDGFIYFYYGGNAAPNRIRYAGYSKTGLPVSRWAFRAGSDGIKIFLDGAEVNQDVGALTRTRATNDEIWFLSRPEEPNETDSVYCHFLACINDQWSDARIKEWSRDPFAMIRRANRPNWTADQTRRGFIRCGS